MKKKLTEIEIDKIISNVRATTEMEGLELTEHAEELLRKVLKGEIKVCDAIEILKAKYGKTP